MCIYDVQVLPKRTVENFAPTRLAIKELVGILYFCKSTEEDIIGYPGSGSIWKDRIKKYGKQNIKTLWVSDWYHNPHEIQEIALHFSKENQIVESGRWANLKPENGLNGGSKKGHKKSKESVAKRSGDNHPNKKFTVREKISKSKTGSTNSKTHIENISISLLGNTRRKDKTTYSFIFISTGEIIYVTRSVFMKTYGFGDGSVSELITGKRKTLLGWAMLPVTGEPTPKLMMKDNSKIYTFENTTTKEIVSMPVNKFMKDNDLSSGKLSQLISGERKSHRGWRLVS